MLANGQVLKKIRNLQGYHALQVDQSLLLDQEHPEGRERERERETGVRERKDWEREDAERQKYLKRLVMI